jgi:hypothetical protein
MFVRLYARKMTCTKRRKKMKLHRIIILMILAALMLAACVPSATPGGPAAGETPAPTTTVPTPVVDNSQPPEAAQLALEKLAERLGIAAGDLQLQKIEEVQWPNACLGLAEPGEMCAEVITDGFRLVIVADGETYEVRTDRSGKIIRFAGDGPKSAPGADELPAAVLAAKRLLAQQTGYSEDVINVVEHAYVDWPNSCLGIEDPAMSCAMVITPGYRVVFEARGELFEFHTDEAGGVILPASAPLPTSATDVLAWEQTTDGGCLRLEAGVNGAAFGACGADLQQAGLEPARMKELAYVFSTYAAFESDTPAGRVVFQGQGRQVPGPAVQRSIAEWAKLVAMEAESGRGGAALGLAMGWHREGGIAGFCDDLVIYRTGWAVPSSCKAPAAGERLGFRLSEEDLKQVFAWIDSLKSFEAAQKDPSVADAMKETLVFAGEGSAAATAELQQEMTQFAAGTFAEAVR